jgi:thioredoxin reductase
MDGSVSWVKALFCRTEKRQVPVVESLGLEMTTEGYVRINENFQTSMKDVYAAGDLAAHYHGALAAAAAGNHAGHCINHDLTLDLVKRCLL